MISIEDLTKKEEGIFSKLSLKDLFPNDVFLSSISWIDLINLGRKNILSICANLRSISRSLSSQGEKIKKKIDIAKENLETSYAFEEYNIYHKKRHLDAISTVLRKIANQAKVGDKKIIDLPVLPGLRRQGNFRVNDTIFVDLFGENNWIKAEITSLNNESFVINVAGIRYKFFFQSIYIMLEGEKEMNSTDNTFFMKMSEKAMKNLTTKLPLKII